jgi:adenylate cyclase
MGRRLAVLMYADLADYGAAARTDEQGAQELLRELEEIARPVLRQRHGHRVRSIGEDRLVEFANAVDAVEGAVAVQERVHERNATDPAMPLRVRIGLHLGAAERRGIGVAGEAVDLISRIGPLVEPGGVWLTEPVYVQARGRVPYPLQRLGPRDLHGVRESIALYRVVLPTALDARLGPGEVVPPAGEPGP